MARAGDREAQWSVGFRLVSEADAATGMGEADAGGEADTGMALGSGGRSPEADAGLLALHMTRFRPLKSSNKTAVLVSKDSCFVLVTR